MFRFLIATIFTLFASFAYSAEQPISTYSLAQCEQLKNETKQIINSQKKVLSWQTVSECIAQLSKDALPKEAL
ncbi:hypothetical protein, partial [Pseudomonas savastanoi]